jgi:hypothetical protein
MTVQHQGLPKIISHESLFSMRCPQNLCFHDESLHAPLRPQCQHAGALQGEPGLPSTEEETRQVMAMCLALCTVLPCTSPTQLVRLSIALGIVNSPEQVRASSRVE